MAALFGAVFFSASLPAATLNWDINGNVPPNTLSDGAGTWNLSSLNWYNGTSVGAYVGASDVIFGAGGGTGGVVTLGSMQSVDSLTFNVSGYDLQGAPGAFLSLSTNGSPITVAAGKTAEIDVPIFEPSALGGSTFAVVVNTGATLNLSGGLTTVYTAVAPVATSQLQVRGGGTLNINGGDYTLNGAQIGATVNQNASYVSSNGLSLGNNGNSTWTMNSSNALFNNTGTNFYLGTNAAGTNNLFDLRQGYVSAGYHPVVASIAGTSGAHQVDTLKVEGGLFVQGIAGGTMNGANQPNGFQMVGNGTAAANSSQFEDAIFNLSGGTFAEDFLMFGSGISANGVYTAAADTTSTATFNMSGGNLFLSQPLGMLITNLTASNVKVNLSGGTIGATASWSSAMTMALGTAGGASGNITFTAANPSNSTGYAITLSGTLTDPGAGKGSLTKDGIGTLNLTAANSYTGTTYVNAGTLAEYFSSGSNNVASNVLSSASSLALGGGTLSLVGSNAGPSSLTSTTAAGNTVITVNSVLGLVVGQLLTGTGLPAGGVYITAINSGPSLNISAATTGTLGTIIVTAETSTANSQQFTGTSVNSGASTISLTQGNSTSIGVDLGVVSHNTGGTLNFNTAPNGTTLLAGATGTSNDASGILGTWATVGSGAAMSYAAMSGNSIVAYAGGTSLPSSGGSASTNYILTASGTASLSGATTANTLQYTGAGLGAVDNGGNTFTLNGLMNAGANTLTLSGAGSLMIGANKELVIWGAGQSIAISSPIVDYNPGAAQQSALTYTGPGTLTLSGSNTYTGVTTVNGGTLSVSNIASGGNLGSGTSAVALNDGGIFNYTGNSANYARGLVIGASGGELDYNPGSTAQTLTMSGGGIDLSSSGYFTIGGTSNSPNITISSVISGSGGVNKKNSGVLTLSGANTYTGATSITAGAVTVGINSVLDTSGALGADSAVTLGNTTGVALNLAGFTAQVGSLAGGGTAGGGINLGGGALIIGGNTVGGTLSTTYSGIISDTGSGSVTKVSGTTQILSGASTYTGATVVNGGILQAGVASVTNVSGAFGKNSAVTVGTNGTLALNNNATQIGSLTGAGNVTLGSATLTTGGDNTSPAAFSGVITGTGGLTKIGTGAQILAGIGNYTGATTVNAGSLLLGSNYAIAPTSAVVLAGGTLGFANGAPYTLSLSTLALNSSSILNFANAGIDSLTFASSSSLTWTGTLSIYNWNGSLDTLAFLSQGLTAAQLADIRFYSDSGTTALGAAIFNGSNNLTFVATPEPQTWAMLGAGALLLLVVARRRRGSC